MSSFGGIYSVRSGLDAARRAMELVGQNVANANTAGYTRQEVSFVAADPHNVIKQVGRGIAEVNVLRYRDEFLDRQYRSRAGMQGYQDTRSAQLMQVEEIIGDLSDGGLRTALDKFFNSWDTLAQYPTAASAKAGVVSAAEEFLGLASRTFQELTAMRSDLDQAVQTKVGEINTAAHELAGLNQAIMERDVSGQTANDLRDRRDMLIDSLAKLAGATSVSHNDGTVTVYLGSLPLVDGNSANPIDAPVVAVEPDMDADPTLTSVQQRLSTFTWNGTTTQPTFPTGEVAALMEMRDKAIPEYMKYLDNLVRTVANEVNTAHRAGVPVGQEQDIFTVGTTWMNVQLDAAVKANPSLIQAAQNVPVVPALPAASDGNRARAIAAVRDKALLTGAPVGGKVVSAGEYLQSISSVLGLQVQQASSLSESAGLQVAQAELRRQSVSGVSLDDEMAKMIQFQQAYNAAARMMTTLDEMLDTVVNRIGLVGR